MTDESFERWISAPPYERLVTRHGDRGTWPGQYKSYGTQLAWEAWQEAARLKQESCAALVEQLSARPRAIRSALNGTQPAPCEYAAAIRAMKG